MVISDALNLYTYFGDNGRLYLVRMRAQRAQAGGFQPWNGVSALEFWTHPIEDMRYVTVGFPGSNPPRKSIALPISRPDHPAWVNGGTVEIRISGEFHVGVVLKRYGERFAFLNPFSIGLG